MLRRVLGRCFFSTQLLTWGPTTYGWGRPASQDVWNPGKVETPENIISVATGETHLGFVTADHSAYACGFENSGTVESETPYKLQFDGNPSIQALACGNLHSLALTTEGAVFAWGGEWALRTATDTPVRIPQEHFGGQKVVSVAAGYGTSLALTEDGKVYAWGAGLHKLLGWDDDHVDLYQPQVCEQIAEICQKRHAKVKKIAAVNHFIMVLLDDGRIYCRGINNGGVFGARMNDLVMSDNTLTKFAKNHDALYKDERIVDFEVASNALIFRTESDRIFFNGMFYAFNPRPFPIEVQPKRIFATEDAVGVVAEDGKVYFLNERLIEDSEVVSKKDRLYVSEDSNLEREILGLGGKHGLYYALLQ